MNKRSSIISADPSREGVELPLEDLADAGPEAEAAAGELRAFTVEAGGHGQRLDRVLCTHAPEFSRSYLQQLVEQGAVHINARVVSRSAHRLKAGDGVEIELRPTPQSQAFVPEPMALDIVHQDPHLLVLNKPAGLVVHPAPGHWRGTLLNGLLAQDPQAAALPRAGIVHRLDKDTSGLMLVARDRPTMDALVRLIAAREVSRQYLALAHRPWQGPAQREVEAAIGRDSGNRLRMAVVDLAREAGKPAATRFELIANAAAGCWVRASLRTGRTHQIRVHMAHLGHPLVADTLYGGAPAAGLSRQALHAYRLALRHPVTGQELAFEAPPPADLAAALAAWGLSYNVPLRP